MDKLVAEGENTLLELAYHHREGEKVGPFFPPVFLGD